MTYGPTRSVNADLHEGLTDGKYKKVINNRGGFVDKVTTMRERATLSDRYYGIHEAPIKTSPDGLSLPTPNFVPTAPPEFY